MGSFVCRRRRSWSLSLCLWVATCHLRPADGAIDCLLRSPEGDSFEAPQVAGLRLVLLSVRSSPSVPKASFSVPGVSVGTEHPSCALVTRHRSPADRLGDVFEVGIILRAHSRRFNLQQISCDIQHFSFGIDDAHRRSSKTKHGILLFQQQFKKKFSFFWIEIRCIYEAKRRVYTAESSLWAIMNLSIHPRWRQCMSGRPWRLEYS